NGPGRKPARAMATRPFRAEDRPWLTKTIKRDDLLRRQLFGFVLGELPVGGGRTKTPANRWRARRPRSPTVRGETRAGRSAQKNIRERGCPRGARDNTPLPEGSVHGDPPAKRGPREDRVGSGSEVLSLAEVKE